MTTEEADAFPTKILRAVDGSEEARRAANLADAFDSELHLVRVEPVPAVYAYPESAAYYPELQDKVREAAGRLISDGLSLYSSVLEADASGPSVEERTGGRV